MRPSAALAVLSLLLLAGCSSPPASGPSAPASASSPPQTAAPSPATDSGPSAAMGAASGDDALSFSGCRQYHTSFPAQPSDLQPLMPEGFTVETDEAGLAQLMVLATDCSEGAAGGAAWLFVEVAAVPPAKYADGTASHAVAIEAYAGRPDLVSWLQARSIGLAEPCSCAATTGPEGPLTDGFTSDGADDDYTMQTALTPDSGPFPAYRAYVYAARDGQAVARLLETGAASTTRGFGSVVLQYSGAGGAPPAFPGEVAHEVEALSLTWTVEALG